MASHDETAIKVSNVSKTFRLPHEKRNSIKSLFVSMFHGKRTYEKQQVLNNISFEVKKGEFLGIVGRNGGGKSTLLKLLAEIYVPDKGKIVINGKITPFIELGVGFNPELTGRENVYLNGALLGFNRAQMDDIYDDIVAFAELERFMDQKLKNYSSGMQVRLAFSVAIQAQTGILLIDEVLAVGDSNFQKKCFKVFEDFKKEKRTVVFISHSMEQVIQFCDRAILINNGNILTDGDPEVVAFEYDMLNNESQRLNKKRLQPRTVRETYLAETILKEFGEEDHLLEVGADSLRSSELINSLGIKTSLLGQKSKLAGEGVVTSLNELDEGVKPTGIIILDNSKSLTKDTLAYITKELHAGGVLSDVKKIYIHMPSYEYQAYARKKNPKASPHLSDPRKLTDITDTFQPHEFSVVSTTSYGEEPYQYNTCLMRRFTKEDQQKLWGQ